MANSTGINALLSNFDGHRIHTFQEALDYLATHGRYYTHGHLFDGAHRLKINVERTAPYGHAAWLHVTDGGPYPAP